MSAHLATCPNCANLYALPGIFAFAPPHQLPTCITCGLRLTLVEVPVVTLVARGAE